MKKFSLLAVLLLAAAPVLAGGFPMLPHPVPVHRGNGGKSLDSLWFTADGVPTHSLVQGQFCTWAVNCLPHDTIHFESWVDANGNGTFDSTGAGADVQLFEYITANGDTSWNNGLPDTTAALDSMLVNGLKEGGAPALYWMKATSLVTDQAVKDSFRILPLATPWATISGHVHVPGDSALQANLLVQTELDNKSSAPVFWAGLTDSAGNYTINFDNVYRDSTWRVGRLRDIFSGGMAYVAPPDIAMLVDSGAHGGVNFIYVAATDSITGDVTLYPSGVPPFAIGGGAKKQNGGADKNMVIDGNHYQVFFAASDTGEWGVGVRPTTTITDYMQPQDVYHLYPVGAGHTVQDFVFYPADDSIKGRVTEQGSAPAHTYEVYTSSYDLNANAVALTDAQGYYMLRVSSLDSSYSVQVEDNDDRYPIPSGWRAVPGSYGNVDPPASGIDFNLTPATEFINGSITQDGGDAVPIDFNATRARAEGHGWIEVNTDSAGNYSLAVFPDTFRVAASSDRFLFKPGEYQNVIVHADDTIRNMDFLANYGHCRVAVTLAGFPSGDTSSTWLSASDSASWPNGYETGTRADSAITYSLYICNSGGWRVNPPHPSGYQVDSNQITLGDITHGDTLRQVTFHYATLSSALSGHLTQDAGDAQGIDYRWTNISASRPNDWMHSYSTGADSLGYYLLPVPPDTYRVTANTDQSQHHYLFKPVTPGTHIVSANDTLTNVDFIANYGNCHVRVTLVGYPNDSSGQRIDISDSIGWPDGYMTGVMCNAAGTYDLYICNSGGWRVNPPRPNGWQVDSNQIYLGTITHADTLRLVTFHYSQLTSGISGTMTQDPGDAQPFDFRWATVYATRYNNGGIWYNGGIDSAGHYFIGAPPDSYSVNANTDTGLHRFLFRPAVLDTYVVTANDTVQNVDLIANYAHRRVVVTISGYPDSSAWFGAAEDSGHHWGRGYMTGSEIHGNGTYTLYLCNAADWWMSAPNAAGYTPTPWYYAIGTITHADTSTLYCPFSYTPSGVAGKQVEALPTRYELAQNAPNPCAGATVIRYQLPKPGDVRLRIFNILGQEVRSFDEGVKPAGRYAVRWDGRDGHGQRVSGGIYFYRLQAGGYNAIRKMTVLR